MARNYLMVPYWRSYLHRSILPHTKDAALYTGLIDQGRLSGHVTVSLVTSK